MAEEDKKEAEDGEAGEAAESEDGPAKRKLPIKLVGGVVGVVAAGAILAQMALPKKEVKPRLEGPFFVSLAEEPIPVSTIDSDNRRYVKFALDAEFTAYDGTYVKKRWDDPFFPSMLRASIELAASDKTIKEITEGSNREVFAEELREAVNPVVFPLHVGETKNPTDKDAETGLRPGVSRDRSTFRGRFHDHVLALDGTNRTLRVDDGPTVVFEGHEEDLRVDTAQGDYLYVDVTHYEEGFVGEVPVGVMGRLRRLVLHQTIAQ